MACSIQGDDKIRWLCCNGYRYVLPCKAKMQYMLTLQGRRYCLWVCRAVNMIIYSRKVYTFFNNNTPHGEQRWTVLIRQLLHTYQWQHATQWATRNCINQTIVHCANSCKQSYYLDNRRLLIFIRLKTWKTDNNSQWSQQTQYLDTILFKFRAGLQTAEWH